MKYNYLTMDINIAYSMLNMKLRDFYSSIDILCEDEEVDKEALIPLSPTIIRNHRNQPDYYRLHLR